MSPHQPVSYDGATTIGLQLFPDLLPLLRQRGHDVSPIGERGTNKGLEAVRKGEVEVAGVMRAITPAEQAEPLRWALIGHDALGVFVHPKNPVRSLTREQLKAVFTGQVRSWRELGGPDLPVVPVTEIKTGGRGTVLEFQRIVLGGAAYGPTRELEDAPDCLVVVAQEPGGISMASMSMALPGLPTVAIDGVRPDPVGVRSGSYLLGRPMYLVARAQASQGANTLLDLALSDAGQAIVGRKFTPAR